MDDSQNNVHRIMISAGGRVRIKTQRLANLVSSLECDSPTRTLLLLNGLEVDFDVIHQLFIHCKHDDMIIFFKYRVMMDGNHLMIAN